jgi:CRP/FNR family transcriptional regulator, cyclic AMP receptor protein
MEMVWLLHRMPLFAGLSPDESQMIARITKPQRYTRHQVIIRAGERGSVFFLLTAGIVRVSVAGQQGKEIILGVLYPNDFFGEMALLDGLPRLATVTTLADSEVLMISRQEFLNCIRRMPQIAAKMIITLSLRLRRADQKLGALVFLKAPRRVARTLLELAQGQGQRTPAGIMVNLLFTRQELAELAGVSRETCIRLLTKFQRQGVLTLDRRKLLVPNLQKLEELA